MNWIGESWMEEHNNGILPSLNQIKEGLIAEAIKQLELTMGDVRDLKAALEAQANLKKTLEDLLDKA